MLEDVLGRLFTRESIDGHGTCPPYLYRWHLLKVGKWCSVYLHHFVGDDWSSDMHDHPKRFVSIGLKGEYLEETPGRAHRYKAPWIRSFPARWIHRIRARDCWTLVFVGPASREWGFWHFFQPNTHMFGYTSGWGWIPWEPYVHDKEMCEVVKTC